MAVTADQVVVQLQAQTAQYEAGMRKALARLNDLRNRHSPL